MKSPKDMRIIQIDITNACVFQCSNCTRFCGHHKKPFFMDFETFKRAVDSLEGYVGTIGIMGGEPTLNPDFEKMAEYLASRKPHMVTDKLLRPQRHFMDGIHDLEYEHTFLHPCGDGMRQTVDGPGLWATTLANYKKHYELIQDTIQYQALNDHSNVSFHQPALISRKALGINDEEWIPMRDACWLQNLWSASITPKGAFFCEVAASLDMLFDGSGGWEIGPGWWKKTPDEFGEQLEWCEVCGLACETFMRNANESVYDVSEDVYDKLKKAGSRLVDTKHISVTKIVDGVIDESSKPDGKNYGGAMPYTKSYAARYDEKISKLTYKEFACVLQINDEKDIETAIDNAKMFNQVYVHGTEEVTGEFESRFTGSTNVKCVNSSETSLGYVLFDLLKDRETDLYAVILTGQIELKNLISELNELVMNPGVLLVHKTGERECSNDWFKAGAGSQITILCGAAGAIKKAGWDNILKIKEVDELRNIWNPRKVLPCIPEVVYEAPTDKIYQGRYVVYGTGNTYNTALNKVLEGGAAVAGVCDSNPDKWGTTKSGYIIQNPKELLANRDGYDYVMIGSSVYYKEIKKVLLEMGISEDRMAWI